MRISDGDKCPRTGKHVMIRSDLGCLKCKFKISLNGENKVLSVNCGYKTGKSK